MLPVLNVMGVDQAVTTAREAAASVAGAQSPARPNATDPPLGPKTLTAYAALDLWGPRRDASGHGDGEAGNDSR